MIVLVTVAFLAGTIVGLIYGRRVWVLETETLIIERQQPQE